MEFLDWFKWICLGLFTATAVIWLLDMIALVKIRTAAQRTMLNAALGTTLIGGMASFAVSNFFTPPGPGEAPAIAAGPSRAPAGAMTPAPTPTSTSTLAPTDASPTAPVAPEDPALPEPVRAFLAANNLVRPAIATDWEARYPACAVQSRTSQLPAAEARLCFRALDRFNDAVLIPYQDAYDVYVPRVAELSYSQPAGDVLAFLTTEAGGFSRGTHPMAELYRNISNTYAADAMKLRSLAYR